MKCEIPYVRPIWKWFFKIVKLQVQLQSPYMVAPSNQTSFTKPKMIVYPPFSILKQTILRTGSEYCRKRWKIDVFLYLPARVRKINFYTPQGQCRKLSTALPTVAARDGDISMSYLSYRYFKISNSIPYYILHIDIFWYFTFTPVITYSYHMLRQPPSILKFVLFFFH